MRRNETPEFGDAPDNDSESAGWISPTPPKSVKPDSKIDKWVTWLESYIKDEVIGVFHRRAVYRSVGEIVNRREPKLPPSLFLDFLSENYVTTQAMAIRRQADTDPRVGSLARLISEIQSGAERLTLDRYASEWPAGFPQWFIAPKEFAEHFGGTTGDHLDPEIVAEDLQRLLAKSQAVVDFVDRHIAHHDRKPVKTLPTWEELNGAIDEIGELFNKYTLLLTQSSWGQLEPVAGAGWTEIFEYPWIVREAPGH